MSKTLELRTGTNLRRAVGLFIVGITTLCSLPNAARAHHDQTFTIVNQSTAALNRIDQRPREVSYTLIRDGRWIGEGPPETIKPGEQVTMKSHGEKISGITAILEYQGETKDDWVRIQGVTDRDHSQLTANACRMGSLLLEKSDESYLPGALSVVITVKDAPNAKKPVKRVPGVPRAKAPAKKPVTGNDNAAVPPPAPSAAGNSDTSKT